MWPYNRNLRSNNKRIYMLWSPKSGSATLGQIFFEYINFDYDKNKFIHFSIREYEKIQKNTIPLLPLNDYLCLQLVRNSYIRAASAYMVSQIRNSDWYLNINCYPIGNNISFIDFLYQVKYIIDNKYTLDPHYGQQRMPNTQYIVEHNGIVRLEHIREDINRINLRENINLNSSVVYDIHSSKKINKKYIEYKYLYKDPLSKKLVDSIYGEDIDTLRFSYPY